MYNDHHGKHAHGYHGHHGKHAHGYHRHGHGYEKYNQKESLFTDQIKIKRLSGQLIQLILPKDFIGDKYFRFELRFTTDSWRTTNFLYNYRASQYSYIGEKFLIGSERVNSSSYCINRCASNPNCYYVIYKNDHCYLYNTDFEKAPNKEPCTNAKCFTIDRTVSNTKNFKIAYDKEYQFRIRLLDRYILKWVSFKPILKYYIKSKISMSNMQYNTSNICYGYGDPHYRSFFRSKINVNKSCSYIIGSNDCSGQKSQKIKFNVITDHHSAFGNVKAKYIRAVRIYYNGVDYSISNTFKVNGKNQSLPFYASDSNRDNKVFAYRYNRYIVFDAKPFNVLYDGLSMLKFRTDKFQSCGICNFDKTKNDAQEYFKTYADPNRKCV